MKLLRRALAALAFTGLAAAALRVRGTGGTPPQRGGWRPLEIPADTPSGTQADSPTPATRP